MKKLFKVMVSGYTIVYADNEKEAIEEAQFGVQMNDYNYLEYNPIIASKENLSGKDMEINPWGIEPEDKNTVGNMLKELANPVYRICGRLF